MHGSRGVGIFGKAGEYLNNCCRLCACGFIAKVLMELHDRFVAVGRNLPTRVTRQK